MRRFMLVIVSNPSHLLDCDRCANVLIVTTGKIMTMEELSNVQGRAWEDVDVSDTERKIWVVTLTDDLSSIDRVRTSLVEIVHAEAASLVKCLPFTCSAKPNSSNKVLRKVTWRLVYG